LEAEAGENESAKKRGETKEDDVGMSVDEIIEAINKLSVLELVELKDKLQEQWGVTAAAPVAVAAMPGAAAAPVEEEKTEFDVVLTDVGENKIHVIKAVREVTNLGLKEAKELVETPGAVVAEQVSKEEANNIKEKLEAAGAKVELR
jgi:large subunit ribosomal protein L7/L12